MLNKLLFPRFGLSTSLNILSPVTNKQTASE